MVHFSIDAWTIIQLTNTETPYEYRRKFTVAEKIAPGHSRAGEYKAGSGSKAEQIVSNYLNSKKYR